MRGAALRHKFRARDLRHRLRGWHHRLLNARLSEDEMRLAGGPTIRVHPDARRAFGFFTMHDPAMVSEFRGFLRQTRACRCLIDVGAHYGLFSMAFASRPGAVAYAVEPSPGAQKILAFHRDANPGLGVHPLGVAVGAVAGELAVDDAGDDHVIAAHNGSLRVPVVSIDGLVAERELRPDVLKIDVEGMELDVLKGAGRTLGTSRPRVFLEVHPAEIARLGGTVGDVATALHEAGYSFQTTGGRDIADLEAFCAGHVARIVATPRPHY